MAQRRLPSIELKHPHRQTRWRRGIAPLAAVFSTAYTEVPAGRWTVLRVVNGWPSLDSFNIHDIARRDREEKPSFRARTVGVVSTVSTPNTAVFHPVLTFQLFSHA